MNNSKMIKQLMPLLAIIMCSALISGCSSNNNQTSESTDSEVVVETKESKEEVVNEVLRTSFTINEDESESFSAGEGDIIEIIENRANKVKTYFTDSGFNGIRRTRMTTPLFNIFGNNECTSTVDEIELDFRKTSNSNELVCYYKLNITINFKDDSVEPFTGLIEGSMTLLEKDSWKINYFYMSNMKSFYSDFYNHIND